jgi:putative transposase
MPKPSPSPRYDGPRYHLGPCDRLTIDDIEYSVAGSDDDGHVISRIDRPQPEFRERLSHGELADLLNAPQFRHDRDWFRPEVRKVRERAGVSDLRDLSDCEQERIQFKAEAVRVFEEWIRGKGLKRSDKPMRDAKDAMKAEVDRRLELKAASGKHQRGAGRYHSFRFPGPKRLREWRNDLIEAGGDVLTLRDGHHRSGNRNSRLTPAAYALLVRSARGFIAENRPYKKTVFQQMQGAFLEENARRLMASLPELRCPSERRLREEIGKLPKFEVAAGRHGSQYAKGLYMSVGEGIIAPRAFQRLEMDMWSSQLHVLFNRCGLWQFLSEEGQEIVARAGRKVVCAAVDYTTNVIAALHIGNSETTETAISCLQMAMTDKQSYADAVGALTHWDCAGTPEELATDTGAPFISDRFKAAVRDARVGKLLPPAKLPHLRGTVERAFRTAHTKLVSRFTGRTFEDVVRKGGYDSQARASLNEDDYCWVLVRYVVDAYHNSPTDGSYGQMPRSGWLERTKRYPVWPPPDRHRRRQAFGAEVERIVTARGVRVLGIYYQSRELHGFLTHNGFSHPLKVRIDPFDLGFISVQVAENEWLSVECFDAKMHGLDIHTWCELIRAIRRRHGKLAQLTAPIVHAAFRDIDRRSDQAILRERLGETAPTAKLIDRLERELVLTFEYAHPSTSPATGTGDLYAKAVKVRGTADPPPRTDSATAPKPPSRKPNPWKLED